MVTKIVVFGSTGLLGSSIAAHFSALPQYDVITPTHSELDLCHYEQLSDFLSSTRPHVIFNCAANVGGLYSQIKRPVHYLHSNLIIVGNLYESVANFTPASHIVNFLSTCCFPVDVTFPITPQQLHNGPPHASNASYSYAKRMIDVYARAYYSELSVSSSTFILGNLFGVNDHFSDPENAHVIPSLIIRAFRSLQDGSHTLTVQGNGKPLREFLFADDVATMLQSYFETDISNASPEPLLFSNHAEISISDLAHKIAQLVSPNIPLNVLFSDTTDLGQHMKPSSTSPSLLQLSGLSFTPIDLALARVIEAYKSRIL